MNGLISLKGKKIKEIRGLRTRDFSWSRGISKRKKGFKPVFILFDDSKTLIELEEQDYYDFHDCDSSARLINVTQNKALWKSISKDKWLYPVADKEE